MEPLATAAGLDPSFDASATYLRGNALLHLERLDEAQTVLVEAVDKHGSSTYAGAVDHLIKGIRYQQRKRKRFDL